MQAGSTAVGLLPNLPTTRPQKHGDDDIQRADGQTFVVGGDHTPVLAEPRRSRRS